MPPWLVVRVLTIKPGAERPYDPGEWCDALVLIERGEIEMRFVSGPRWSLKRGETCCLAELPLLALRIVAEETALLSSVSHAARRQAARSPAIAALEWR
jgi:hypothetical protein